jgi:hypothetical protein
VVVNGDVPNFGEADWLVTNFGRIWKVALFAKMLLFVQLRFRLDINSFLKCSSAYTSEFNLPNTSHLVNLIQHIPSVAC